MKADIHARGIAIEARSGRISLETEFSPFKGAPRRRSARIDEDESYGRHILENQGEFNGQLRF